MPREPLGPDARILVLDLPLGGQTAVVGILADAVHEVTRIGHDALQEVPAVGTRWPARFVEAIAYLGGNVIMLPDLPAIFAAHPSGPAGARQNASGLGPRTQHKPD
jgi:purine-binding chemotaxis protein CheW